MSLQYSDAVRPVVQDAEGLTLHTLISRHRYKHLTVMCVTQVADWVGFLAAQLYNAGTAIIAHVPAWLPGVTLSRDTVWLRRLLLLRGVAPVTDAVPSTVHPPLSAALCYRHWGVGLP